MKHVVILSGPSGSGKSTWVKNLYRVDPGTGQFAWVEKYGIDPPHVVSADNYFIDRHGNYNFDPKQLPKAHGECLRKFVECVSTGKSFVVVDNTNCSIAEVAPYMALSNAYEYAVEVITMLPRGGWLDYQSYADRNLHGVPASGIQRQASNFTKMAAEWPVFWPKIEYVGVNSYEATLVG
jgi:hypothetical protein